MEKIDKVKAICEANPDAFLTGNAIFREFTSETMSLFRDMESVERLAL
jgi:hypothetical protein